MTTEQMKELYPTSEWIAVWQHPISKVWQMNDQDGRFHRQHDSTRYIHKKHKEVLDHLLSGGKDVYCISHLGDDSKPMRISDVDSFIRFYLYDDSVYEIIPTEPKPVERITREEYKAERKALRLLIIANSTILYDSFGNEIKALPINRVMRFLDEYLEANQKEST